MRDGNAKPALRGLGTRLGWVAQPMAAFRQPRDPEGMPGSGPTGWRTRLQQRTTRYSLVVLCLIAGAIMLATGRPAGIGLALLLSALALVATPDRDDNANCRDR